MPLDPETAARIAARHGLGLADAASLRGLTDDPDEADRLAARFAGSGDTKDWLRHLFADPEAVTPAPAAEAVAPPPAGYVAREGSNTTPANDDDTERRQFVRSLFGYPTD
jgi:hypothetical protein